MKLHLPKRLLTALLAAFTAITLSTGSAAWGAAETIEASVTWTSDEDNENHKYARGEYLTVQGDGVTLTIDGETVTGEATLSLKNNANVIITGDSDVTISRLVTHDSGTGATSESVTLNGGFLNITDSDTGSNNFWTAVLIGHWGDSPSTSLNVNGGQLNVLNGTVQLGFSSAGNMVVTGGTANIKKLNVNKGALTLSGGRLNIGSGGLVGGADQTATLTRGTLGVLDAGGWSLGNVTTTIGTITIDTNVWDATTNTSTNTGANINLIGNIQAAAGGMNITLDGTGSLTINRTLAGTITTSDSAKVILASNSDWKDFGATYVNANGESSVSGFVNTLQVAQAGSTFANSQIYIGDTAYTVTDGIADVSNMSTFYYVNDMQTYGSSAMSGASAIHVYEAGTLIFTEGLTPTETVTNKGKVVLQQGENDVNVNTLLGTLNNTATSTTTITTTGAVNTSAALNMPGTLEIENASSFENKGYTLTLDKLILNNVAQSTINGTGGGSGKVSGIIEVLGKSTLILTGSHDLLGWGATGGAGDYTDKILLRGTDAENKAILQLNTRQTCSTAIVLEGYSSITNGGAAITDTSADNNNVGMLQMHNGGSITATGTNNVISAVVKANTATAINVTNQGDTLDITGTVFGSGAITKSGSGALTFTGNVSVNDKIALQGGSLTFNGALTTQSGKMFETSGSTTLVFGGNEVTHTIGGELKSAGGGSSWTINEGTTLNASIVNIAWYLNNFNVKGLLEVTDTLKVAMNNNRDDMISGTGSITTNKLSLSNQSRTRISVNSLTVGTGGVELTGNTSTLKLNNNTTTINGGISIANSGNSTDNEVHFVSGTVTVNGVVTNNDVMKVQGGSVTFNENLNSTRTFTIANGASLTLNGANNTVSGTFTVESGAAITLGESATLDLTSHTLNSVFASVIGATSGEGTVKFAGNTTITDNNRISTRSNGLNINVDTEISNSIAINSWTSNNSTTIITSTLNKDLTVENELRLETHAKLKVADGILSASTISLGHATAGNFGHLEIAGGKVTADTIKATNQNDTANTLTMSSGELELTQAGTIRGIQTSITGGTLSATSASWGIEGTSTTSASIGNVNFNIAEGQSITLGGTLNITGTMSHNSKGTLEFADDTTLVLSLSSLQAEGIEVTADTNGLGKVKYNVVTGTTSYGSNITLSIDAPSDGYSFVDGSIISSSSVYIINTTKHTSDTDADFVGASAYHVNADGVFTLQANIPGGKTVANILTTTTGAGKLSVTAGNIAVASGTSVFQGDVWVESGCNLTLGGAESNKIDFSSLNSMVLNGGTLKWQANGSRLMKLDVRDNSHMAIIDTPTSSPVTIDTVSVAEGKTFVLNKDNAGFNYWNYDLAIGILTGAGAAELNGSATNESNTSSLVITSLKGFTGNISITSRENEEKNKYNATINTGESGAEFTNLSFIGFGESGKKSTAIFNVQGDTQIGTLSATGATVNITAGKTLTLSGGNAEAPVTHSISTLTGGFGSKLNLAENAVLSTITSVPNSITMTGSGTYHMASAGQANLTGWTDSANWTGTVVLNGMQLNANNTQTDLAKLGNENSTIELSNVWGWIMPGVNDYVYGNLKLKNGANGYALKITDGYSDQEIFLKGDISGDGNLHIGTTSTANGMIFNFSGDISEWKSSANATPEIKVVNSGESFTIKLTESANTVNVALNKGAGTLNLTVDTAATFSKSVTVTGLTLHQSATFNDTLTASTISVDANKVLGLAGTEDYTLAAVISGSGSLTKSGENTITLSGANTYTGATRVEGGELVVTKSNANSSSSYYIAEEAKLKVDAFSGEWNKTITGNGTLSMVIAGTDNHANKLTGIGGFTGVLEISKAEESSTGNINLTAYSLANDVSLRLISGNNWSTSNTDTILITQNIELAGKTKEDFMFLHENGKTLELSGVVTGTYLTSGTSYNGYYKESNHYNNLTLSGENSRIDHVYMFESSTLTVNADMFFGTITANNVVIGNETVLTLGGGTSETPVTHSINSLTCVSGSSISISENAELVLSSLSGVSGKIEGDGTLNLALNGTVNGANGIPTGIFAGRIDTVKLTNGTCMEITSYGQMSAFSNIVNLVVEAGSTFSNRLTNQEIGAGDHTLTLAGAGGISDKPAAALAFGHDTGNQADMTMAHSVLLADDATVWVNTSRVGILSGTVNGNGHVLTKTGAGELRLNGRVTDADLEVSKGTLTINGTATDSESVVVNGGTLKLGATNSSMQVGDTATITKAEGGNAATMQNVKLSEEGIASADETKATKGSVAYAKVTLAALAAGTSFSIEDVTLSNVNIAAANATDRVNLSGLSASDVQLTKGEFHMLDKAQPQVGTGGSAINLVEGGPTGLQFSTSLLNGMTLGADASMVVDLGDLSGFTGMDSGKPKFSITLEGFRLSDYTGTGENKGLYFAADSWLGQLLVAQGAKQYVKGDSLEAGAQATAGSGSGVGVSYTSTAVGTVITITGLKVPEPATSTLGLIALTALVSRRRRK